MPGDPTRPPHKSEDEAVEDLRPPEQRTSRASRRESGEILLTQEGRRYLPPRAMRVRRPDGSETTLPLFSDQDVRLGRGDRVDLYFDDDSISREHGRLSLRRFDGAWVYRDLGSRNGSFVSEYVDPPPGRKEDAVRVPTGTDVPIGVGQSLILANGSARITFLRDYPEVAAPQLSATAQQVQQQVEVLARTSLPVFILGPSGSGKTYQAKELHRRSGRRGEFILLNCSRLPSDQAALHSELLGHLKGAFTGTIGDRKGALQLAHEGTLFLDEVESMAAAAQGFLLDLLDGSGSFAPLGAPQTQSWPTPDFRLVSASKVRLADSGLRPDLCYRLSSGGILELPGLEGRREDIPRLVDTFLAELRASHQLHARFAADAMLVLEKARWPGEIRELRTVVRTVVELEKGRQAAGAEPIGDAPTGQFRNPLLSGRPSGADGEKALVIYAEPVRQLLEARERAVGQPSRTTGQQQTVKVDSFEKHARPADQGAASAGVVRKRPEDLTREDLETALAAHGGNKTHAARALGIAPNTLKAKMEKFGLR